MARIRPPTIVSRARNLERIRQISEVAVRHGFGYFFERHNLWHIIPLRRRRVPPAPAQRGRHIREMLEELGPTFIKFGQLLSTRPDIVPADIIEELVRLQDRVPPFPYTVARGVVEAELGLSLDRLFLSFDTEPVAAASIGQVYRALLPDGTEVMVKVQRPDAQQQIERDIDLLYQIAELVRDHLGSLLFTDPVSVVRELARSITREVDYVLEGRNAERFASHFLDVDGVLIPQVFWRYSSRRVLTLQYLPGQTLNVLDLESLSLADRRRLAETLTRTWFKMVLEDGFFHGDPHPANIVFVAPDCIGLIDFGIAGSLSERDMEQGVRLFLGVVRQDLDGVKRTLAQLGVRWARQKDAEMTAALEEGFSRYFGVSLAQVNPGALLRDVLDIIYSLHLELPTRFLVLEKALLTVEGVISTVYPEFNVFDIARPYGRRLLRRQYLPDNMMDRLQRSFTAYRDVFAAYPLQIHDVLEELRDGELEIKFFHAGLDGFAHKLDILTNRVVVAVVAGALGLASALVAVFIEEGPRVFGMSVWGIPGFAVAIVFAAWLLWAIVRSGRL